MEHSSFIWNTNFERTFVYDVSETKTWYLSGSSTSIRENKRDLHKSISIDKFLSKFRWKKFVCKFIPIDAAIILSDYSRHCVVDIFLKLTGFEN